MHVCKNGDVKRRKKGKMSVHISMRVVCVCVQYCEIL